MTHHTFDYATLIRQQGYRLTEQRRLILDAICEGRGHTTVDEIYARLQKKAPSINLATVYRTLDFLCEIRIVVKAQVGKHAYYEIAGHEPHHHLICRYCHYEMELAPALVDAFYATVLQQQHFAIDSQHLTLMGICQECRQSSSP